MRPKHSLDRLLTLKASGIHDLMDSITAQPAEELCGERWDKRARSQQSCSYNGPAGAALYDCQERIRWRLEPFGELNKRRLS
jgi:hypothetical protein